MQKIKDYFNLLLLFLTFFSLVFGFGFFTSAFDKKYDPYLSGLFFAILVFTIIYNISEKDGYEREIMNLRKEINLCDEDLEFFLEDLESSKDEKIDFTNKEVELIIKRIKKTQENNQNRREKNNIFV